MSTIPSTLVGIYSARNFWLGYAHTLHNGYLHFRQHDPDYDSAVPPLSAIPGVGRQYSAMRSSMSLRSQYRSRVNLMDVDEPPPINVIPGYVNSCITLL